MKCILVADDNEDDVFILKRALKSAGVESPLIVVENGQEAVDYLIGTGNYADRREFPLPCLLLLDVKMPYLTGLQVAKWVRQESNLSTLPVLFLTSSNSASDIDQAYRCGANAYLVKPPSLAGFTEMLESVKEFWLTQNQFPPDSAPAAASTPINFPSEGP